MKQFDYLDGQEIKTHRRPRKKKKEDPKAKKKKGVPKTPPAETVKPMPKVKRKDVVIKPKLLTGDKAKFIALLKEGFQIAEILDEIGIDLPVYQSWRAADKHFYLQELEVHGLKPVHDRFLASLRETFGNISAACQTVGITRTTYYNWQRDIPYFAQACDDVQEASIDLAETYLKRNMQKGSDASVIFYLKTKGKSRGYVETTHVISDNKHKFDNMTAEELDEVIANLESEVKGK